jgi:CheY-like chemotaxis protein
MTSGDTARDEIPSAPPGRILVVEDNPVNQRVVERLLSRMGYQCDVVTNGEEAVYAVGAGTYGLVLMDGQMPVMDGYDAARAIRALPTEHSSIPIVAMTASALPGDRDRALEAGMDDYLSKPVDSGLLARVVRHYLVRGEGAAGPRAA